MLTSAVADAERPSDEHRPCSRRQVGVLGLHRLARADDEERAEDARLEQARRAGIAVLHLEAGAEVVPLARVEDPDAAAERLRLPLERAERERRVGPGQDDVGEGAVALPGAEVERLVAEQDVVGAARRGEEALGLGARRLPLVGLPVEELRRALRGPADLEHDEDARSARPPPPGRRRVLRRIPAPTRIAKNGRTKMRWRDSGEVEPPSRAARKAATGTPIAHSASARASARTVTSPTSASTSTTTSAGQRPVLKSPAVCHRYVTIAQGPPSFAPRPPTPTSKRPARTRSVSQNGVPATSDRGERDRGLPEPVAARDEHEDALRGEHERPVRVRCDGEQDRGAPDAPRPPRAAVEGAEEEEEREQREEQEEAVHPRVDTVEEEDPAARRRARSRSTPSCGRRAGGRAGRRAAGSPTANAAETSRRLPRPSPRCATA